MVEFGSQRKEWLSTILDLPNGIPLHDTFNRVLQMLDPEFFSQLLASDGRRLLDTLSGKLLNIEGKKIRDYSPRSKGNDGLYILTAWVGDQELCVGQLAVEEKSNEITAIPQVLNSLDIAGATVTSDAIGCQTQIADLIVAGGGNYSLLC